LFLAQHEREVKDMCLTEFDQDKYDEMIRRESREEGFERGREETLQVIPEIVTQLSAGISPSVLRQKYGNQLVDTVISLVQNNN
jgi:hypothetical protein